MERVCLAFAVYWKGALASDECVEKVFKSSKGVNEKAASGVRWYLGFWFRSSHVIAGN